MDKEKDEENKRENKEIKEERSLAWKVIKGLMITNIITIFLWLTTIGGFLWYLYQYDYVSDTTTTTIDGGETGDANYINSGGDVSNIINGKGDLNNYGKDNSTNNEETTN